MIAMGTKSRIVVSTMAHLVRYVAMLSYVVTLFWLSSPQPIECLTKRNGIGKQQKYESESRLAFPANRFVAGEFSLEDTIARPILDITTIQQAYQQRQPASQHLLQRSDDLHHQQQQQQQQHHSNVDSNNNREDDYNLLINHNNNNLASHYQRQVKSSYDTLDDNNMLSAVIMQAQGDQQQQHNRRRHVQHSEQQQQPTTTDTGNQFNLLATGNKRAPGSKTCHPAKPFVCPSEDPDSGECIPIQYLCDGAFDCPPYNGSPGGYDEDSRLCTAVKRPPVEDTANFLKQLISQHGPNYIEKLFGSQIKEALSPLGGPEKVAVALSVSRTIEDFGKALHLMRGDIDHLRNVLVAVQNMDGAMLKSLGIVRNSDLADMKFFLERLLSTGFLD